MKKREAFAAMALAALLALTPLESALAEGIGFGALQQTDAAASGYVEKGLEIRSMRLPLAAPVAGGMGFFYAAAAEGNVVNWDTEEFYSRFLGEEGGYYRLLTFGGKQMYIKKEAARRSTRKVQYVSYPAGSYGVKGETKVVSVVDPASGEAHDVVMGADEEISVDPATGVVDYVPADPNTVFAPTTKINITPKLYYLAPLKGKTARLTIAEDAAGKDVIQRYSVEQGMVFLPEQGSYVIVENGRFYDARLAPSSALKGYIDANSADFDPGEGAPYDPETDYDSMGMRTEVVFG